MNELLSVIIPNYNKEKYICQCLDSVLKQTYPNIQIVVVDDCSKDQSPQIIKEYAQKYSNIKAILLTENGGVSHARNLGIKQADGSYITMLDSDDFYSNDEKLLYEMNVLKEHNGIGVSYSYRQVVNEKGELLYSEKRHLNRYISGKVFYKFLTEKDACSYVQRDMCMPKEAILEVGGYNESESYYEDYDLVLRLSEKFPFYYTGIDGTSYRIMNGLATTQKKNDAMQFRVPQKIRLKYIKRLKINEKIKAYVLWGMESARLEVRILGRKILRKMKGRGGN